MDLWKISEADFRRAVEATLLPQVDPDVPLGPNPAREVRVGSYIFDLLSKNAAGGLTIVEFKVSATKDALAQLLLYPRALRRALAEAGGPKETPIRTVLVSPFIDRGVVELAKLVSDAGLEHLSVRLAVVDGGQLTLVDPATVGASHPKQLFDQAADARAKRSAPEVTWDDGVIVRKIRLGDPRPV